jgi:hypothetical protein
LSRQLHAKFGPSPGSAKSGTAQRCCKTHVPLVLSRATVLHVLHITLGDSNVLAIVPVLLHTLLPVVAGLLATILLMYTFLSGHSEARLSDLKTVTRNFYKKSRKKT